MCVVLPLTALAALAGCDRAPTADGLRDWSPADHDQPPRASTSQGTRSDAGGVAGLVEAAWRNQCSTCHGPRGRGDGPQGSMYKPPDLTAEAFQSRVKDEEIAGAVRNGKGRMPRFDLPDDVVRGLVVRVRSLADSPRQP